MALFIAELFWESVASPLSNPNFDLKLEIISSCERGPLVIRSKCTYVGKDQLKVDTRSIGTGSPVIFSDHWRHRMLRPTDFSHISGAVTLEPNETTYKVACAHSKYTNIVSERLSARATWVVKTHPSGKLISIKTAILTVDIRPITDKTLNDLRERLLFELNNDSNTKEMKASLADWLVGAEELRIAPLALMLYEHPACRHRRDLLYHVDSLNRDKDGLEHFLAYLQQPKPIAADDIYDYIHRRQRLQFITDKQWQSLRREPDLLVRLLLYCRVPNQFNPAQSQSLLEEATKYKQRVQPQIIDPILRRLKDDAFRIREQATSELIALGEMALPNIRETLTNKLSADENARLLLAVKKITQTIPSTFEQALMGNFRQIDSPEADRVLTALAKNHPDAWLTQEAISELKRRKR